MRWLTKLWGAVLAVAATAAADPGYLATVGPPPLRFAEPSKPGAVKVVLPPLLMAETNELATVAEPPPPPPPLREPPSASNSPPFEINILGPADLATNAAPVVVREAEVVSPQMWLKYFTRNTNAGTGAAIVAPIGFLPPQPATPPSSKSAYQTGP